MSLLQTPLRSSADGVGIDAIAAVTHPFPYPYYAELAGRQTMFRDDKNGVWVASRAAVLEAIFRHPSCRVRPVAEPVPKALLGSAAADIFRHLVRMNDGAGHCPFKHAIANTLQGLDMPKIEREGRRWAQYLADRRDSGGGHRWLDCFAFDMPVYAVASLLGMPTAALPDIALLMHDFVPCLAAGGSAEQLKRGKRAAAELTAIFTSMLKQPPAEGLLSRLAQQAALLGCGDAAVIAANGVGLILQSYEATAGLIANTLYALAHDAALRKQVQHDPVLLHACLAEVLRCDPPVQNTRRFVAEDCEIDGQALKAGDVILLVLAAANLDPVINSRPQVFDARRRQRRHFTFGNGVHLCPGPSLAAGIAHAAISHLCAMDLDFVWLQHAQKFRSSPNIRMRLYSA